MFGEKKFKAVNKALKKLGKNDSIIVQIADYDFIIKDHRELDQLRTLWLVVDSS